MGVVVARIVGDEMRTSKEPAPLTPVFASGREQGAGSALGDADMERLQRLLKLAMLRGDRAAELIIRGQLYPESDLIKRLMDGNR